MFEKVNPSHPDKVADRIAGAVVDAAYSGGGDPRVAVEVLIGHGVCHVIAETSAVIGRDKVAEAVRRIAGDVELDYMEVAQDPRLADNQAYGIRCGDNGIFRGAPITGEQRRLSDIMRAMYGAIPSDGKAVIGDGGLVICQSNATDDEVSAFASGATVNPIGFWTGGTDVDSGATNRKLGSDMGDAVTGGGLHGKDLSKADVSVNIYAHLKAQRTGEKVELSCAIGDEEVDGMPYSKVVEIAREYVNGLGGFEKLAEWGLI